MTRQIRHNMPPRRLRRARSSLVTSSIMSPYVYCSLTNYNTTQCHQFHHVTVRVLLPHKLQHNTVSPVPSCHRTCTAPSQTTTQPIVTSSIMSPYVYCSLTNYNTTQRLTHLTQQTTHSTLGNKCKGSSRNVERPTLVTSVKHALLSYVRFVLFWHMHNHQIV